MDVRLGLNTSTIWPESRGYRESCAKFKSNALQRYVTGGRQGKLHLQEQCGRIDMGASKICIGTSNIATLQLVKGLLPRPGLRHLAFYRIGWYKYMCMCMCSKKHANS